MTYERTVTHVHCVLCVQCGCVCLSLNGPGDDLTMHTHTSYTDHIYTCMHAHGTWTCPHLQRTTMCVYYMCAHAHTVTTVCACRHTHMHACVCPHLQRTTMCVYYVCVHAHTVTTMCVCRPTQHRASTHRRTRRPRLTPNDAMYTHELWCSYGVPMTLVCVIHVHT